MNLTTLSQPSLRTLVLVVAVVTRHASAEPIVGDRNPDVHCVYPAAAFHHNEDRELIFDVTKPPYNLKGDGRTDCTDGLVRLYTDILDRLMDSGWKNAGPDYAVSPIMYFPKGTYLVSDTIIYSGEERAAWNLIAKAEQERVGRRPSEFGAWDEMRGGVPALNFSTIKKTSITNLWEHVARIRFVGESRDATIIRLKDGARGFGEGERKPILSFGKSHFNNHVARNCVRNLTIDSGSGNPGAVGIHLNGANVVDISNVTVRSGDGKGVSGIDVIIPPTQGYHSNITVEGFDYGIYLGGFHVTHPVFEYVTLSNQRKAGIYVAASSTSIRSLHSTNNVPALVANSPASQVTLLDSKLTGGSADAVAIEASEGSVLLRNIQSSGYRAASNRQAGDSIDEMVVGQTIPAQAKTLNLPIEDVPEFRWEDDLGQWANVRDFGAIGDGDPATDDTKAIQKALNSGRSVIYFPAGSYRTKGPLTVPASVKTIYGRSHAIRMKLEVDEASDFPLWIVDCNNTSVNIAANRTVVLNRVIFSGITSTAKDFRPKVHVLGSSACGIKQAPNMDIWCRFINPEGHFLPLTAGHGTKLWILGYKTERGQSVGKHDLKAVAGGKLEVLGGVSGVGPHGILVNDGGDVSITTAMSTNGFLKKNEIDVIIDGDRVYRNKDLPQRPIDKKHPPQSCMQSGEVMIPLLRSLPQ